MATGAVVLTAAMALGGCRFEFTVEALTADTDGPGTNDGTSSGAQLSADGTKVVFTSRASDLGPADTNGYIDVYLHDLASRTTSLVSVNTAGGATALGAYDPELSADGTKVVFVSGSADLGPPDEGVRSDVYVRNLVTGTTTMASRNPAGTGSGNGVFGRSDQPVISPDGTKVAFISTGDSFGPLDPYDNWDEDADVLLHDLTTGSTVLVSRNAAGDNGGNRRSEPPVFTPDGRALYFASRADDLVPGAANGQQHIYRYDIATDELSLATTNVSGAAANGSVVRGPLVSPDGRRLVFTTEASDLGPTDTNGGP